MMSLLHRYVLRRFIYCYVLSATGLIGIFLVVDFFERVDEFIRRDMPYSDLIYYFIFKIPSIAFYMAPQAVLLATVITLAVLARDNEIIAMKAGGIGIVGITLPNSPVFCYKPLDSPRKFVVHFDISISINGVSLNLNLENIIHLLGCNGSKILITCKNQQSNH